MSESIDQMKTNDLEEDEHGFWVLGDNPKAKSGRDYRRYPSRYSSLELNAEPSFPLSVLEGQQMKYSSKVEKLMASHLPKKWDWR